MIEKEKIKYCTIYNNLWCGKSKIKECELCDIKPKKEDET